MDKNFSPFIVRFWGVRGSFATPGSATARYGGNTACVEVQAGSQTIILDCGTGIIGLGSSLMQRARQAGQPVRAVILFSHLHHDHTQGFPFFAPAHMPSTRLQIYGPDFLNVGPRQALECLMAPPYFPLRLSELSAQMDYASLRECDQLVLPSDPAAAPRICLNNPLNAADESQNVTIRVLRSPAHPGGVFSYRIEYAGHSVVYATDVEGYVNGDQRLAQFARCTDLLIHDAQYTDEHYLGRMPGVSITQGYGHSTVSMACQAGRSALASRLALFHHAPEYDDAQMDRIGQQVQQFFPGALVAYEGLEVHLNADESLLCGQGRNQHALV